MIIFNQTVILLILFFGSLASIIYMIWKKLRLLQNGQALPIQEVSFEVPHLDKVKHLTIANIKKYEHMALEAVIRFYVKSSNFLKDNYREIKGKIKARMNRKSVNGEKKETSKFLKVVGEYKNKIREIRHKITKEENL